MTPVAAAKHIAHLNGEVRQFSILTRHFFNRFFRNDVVDFEDQMKEKLITGMVFLTVLGGHIANSILMKYIFLLDDPDSWVEKSYFIFFFMALLGFITVIEWDVIFPDGRDYFNLVPLPVRVRTFFLAKFASFSLFIAAYSVAVNALGGFAFAFYLSQFHSPGVGYFLRHFLAHVVSVSAACAFIFLLCVLIQGLLMCFLSYHRFRKISPVFRFLLLTSFIFFLLFSLSGSASGPGSLSSFPEMRERNAVFLYAFPPMWFVGLYEALLGNRDPFFEVLANFAALSLLAAVGAVFVASRISYQRHLQKSPEVRRGKLRWRRLRSRFAAGFNGLFLRNPTQRAVFYFFGQTLWRSTLHKVRLFSYMAASSGLALILLVSTKAPLRRGPILNKTLLTVPLILSFSLVLGIRILANIPSSLEANWVFRITEGGQTRHYLAGFKKGVFFYTLVPLFAALFGFYYYLWGWRAALLHGLYGLVVSSLLLEALFFRYLKIPFASAYLPGKARIHLFWLFYVIAFFIYLSLLSSVEQALFRNPGSFYYFFGAVGLLFLAFAIHNHRFLSGKIGLVYDEEPEPVMVSL
jgi:hypothetical protein